MLSKNQFPKQKNVLKLFGLIPLWCCKKRGGKYTYSLLGIPIWKIRKMENSRIAKYYLFNIPILKAYNQINTPLEILAHQQQYIQRFEKELSEQLEQSTRQLQLLNEHKKEIVLHKTMLNAHKEEITLHKTMLNELYDVCSKIKTD